MIEHITLTVNFGDVLCELLLKKAFKQQVFGKKVVLPTRFYRIATKPKHCALCGQCISHWVLHYDRQYDRFQLTPMVGNVIVNVDHIIPKSMGGRDVACNMQYTCSTCNAKKANTIHHIVSVKRDAVNLDKFNSLRVQRLNTLIQLKHKLNSISVKNKKAIKRCRNEMYQTYQTIRQLNLAFNKLNLAFNKLNLAFNLLK